jgi:hypothetical protein
MKIYEDDFQKISDADMQLWETWISDRHNYGFLGIIFEN